MKKLIQWFDDIWVFIASVFLLAFIPLYPKLPLLDIKNTWVYVRAEDFVVFFVLALWIITFIRKRLTLRTPLTVPILAFWFFGALATIHSILLIVPTVWEIFPNVAFLSYVRRIEYMSLFFIAATSIRDKKYVIPLLWTVTLTVLAASIYGIGQKYLGFPAFLTMNEEFAKGIPITLSRLSRVSSTFGGHYDLAAYLVLTMPIIVSTFFAVRSMLLKAALFLVTVIGAIVLAMTVSRISLFALFVALGLVLFFQKRKLVLFLVPVAVFGVILLVLLAPNLIDRFTSTVKEVDVLLDAKTGTPIGHIKTVPASYFSEKTVRQYFYDSIDDVAANASPSAKFVIPSKQLPDNIVVLTEPTAPTGEDLPSGTGYINLTLSPDIRRLGEFMYEPKVDDPARKNDVYVINGQYLVKRAAAYDLSFTTRFQGEWPNALKAFKRNIFFGSGYGSVSLAVDNSYLRMLAEVGLLGFVTFVFIFLIFGVYLFKTLPVIESPFVRSFGYGLIAGVVGLSINAIFIDVFEASKVAFVLWLLIGSMMGLIHASTKISINIVSEVKRMATSHIAILIYLAIAVFLLWSPVTKSYFVGDDYTWLRWVADCDTGVRAVAKECPLSFSSIVSYFKDADGFFYRPGTKLYFAVMYTFFWLNQTAYHTVSMALHFVMSAFVFFLGVRLFGRKTLAALAAFLFVILSGFGETVFWISVTGHMISAVAILASLFAYMAWRERKKSGYFILSVGMFVFSLLFYELGVVTPFFFLLYEYSLATDPMRLMRWIRQKTSWILLAPLPVYAVARFVSQSHWLNGDYSFNILKFPLNAVGNAVGYILVSVAGPFGMSLYSPLRAILRGYPVVAIVIAGIGACFGVWIVRRLWKSSTDSDRRNVLFSAGFFVIALLPFLGLGNIAARYGYFASVGLVLLFTFGLEKLYAYIRVSGKDVAMVAMAVLVSFVVLLNVVGIYELQKDWNEAGDMAQNFLISMDSVYLDAWGHTPMEFHYVNRPIIHGSAWVFPVGLPDALWFVFRNADARVFYWSSKEEAFAAVVTGSPTQKVFEFTSSGSVELVNKPAPQEP